MENGLVKQELFKVLIPFIESIEYKTPAGFDEINQRHYRVPKPDYVLTINIPNNLKIDEKEVLKYFYDDATLNISHGKPMQLVGRLKDAELAEYLSKEYRQTFPHFNNAFYPGCSFRH